MAKRAAGDRIPPGPAGQGPQAGEAEALEAFEAGRLLFAKAASFVAAAEQFVQLPPARLPEVAFAGRSNVGKSSLINALTGQRHLARTSSTPGRTRQIIFFDLAGRLMLVDLPGYGFAAASKATVKAWSALAEQYLRGRPSLKRVLLLIDARRGVMVSDRIVMKELDQRAVSYVGILTKADAVPRAALADTIATLEAELAGHVAAYPAVFVTSARTGEGLPALQAHLATLARPLADCSPAGLQ